MLNPIAENFCRDLSFLRKLMMVSLASRNSFSLLLHRFGNLYSFSLKTDSGEESYPLFFETKSQLLSEASKFLSDYNLRINVINGQQKEYKIS